MSEKQPHTAPQVAIYDAPEVVRDQAGLEVNHNYPPTQTSYELATDGVYINDRRRTILGLRPFIFWLILVFIIVVAAVGGGVGGSMASTSSSGAPSLVPSSEPDTAAPPISSGATIKTDSRSLNIAAATSSTTSTTAQPSFTSSAEVASQTRGWTGCPASNGTKYSSHGSEFTILCDLLWAWGSNDVAIRETLNLQQCIDQCGMWNQAYAPKSICYLAVFGKQYNDIAYKNCWMKGVPMGGSFPLMDDKTVAAGMMVNF